MCMDTYPPSPILGKFQELKRLEIAESSIVDTSETK